jgi:hypothetical protein
MNGSIASLDTDIMAGSTSPASQYVKSFRLAYWQVPVRSQNKNGKVLDNKN